MASLGHNVLTLEVLQDLRCHQSYCMMSPNHWPNHDEQKMCISAVSTVPADGLAPQGARPSAATVMTNLSSCIYTRLALERLHLKYHQQYHNQPNLLPPLYHINIQHPSMYFFVASFRVLADYRQWYWLSWGPQFRQSGCWLGLLAIESPHCYSKQMTPPETPSPGTS